MSEAIVWTPSGPTAFEHTHIDKLLRAERRLRPGAMADEAESWLASIKKPGAPAGEILGFSWQPTRKAAFDWCFLQVAPDVPSSGLIHLIGEAATT